MAHLLRVAAAALAAWVVLSVPLGLLLGRWLRRASRTGAPTGPAPAADRTLRAVRTGLRDRPTAARTFRDAVRGHRAVRTQNGDLAEAAAGRRQRRATRRAG